MTSLRNDNETDDTAPASRARRQARKTLALAIGLPLGVIALVIALTSPAFLEMRLSVLLKLAAGVIATVVLAAGLMAASFYSDASGHDDDAPGA